MARSATPIDRRITVCPVPRTPPAHMIPALVEFRNSWGERAQIFDSRQLAELPGDLHALLVNAFQEHGAGLAVATRQSAWFALRRFTSFIVQDGSISGAGDLDSAALGRYVLWLHDACRASTRRRARSRPDSVSFNLIRPILQWCQRNRPGQLPDDSVQPVSREAPPAGTEAPASR